MKIVVLGTRGIPGILGGVETHCEELYPRLAKQGHDITVITRRPYVDDKKRTTYKGVKLKHLYAPKKKSFEAVTHTFLGVGYAAAKRPDFLHIHAVGPMLLTPLAKILGLSVIVTHHGADYNREKWGKLAKKILKLGEKMGVKYADKVIVISEKIKRSIEQKYGRNDLILIPNGVTIPNKCKNMDYIHSLGLIKDEYIIAVGRFVPEKGFSDLIEAFSKIKTDVKLVLVGDADHETAYSKKLKQEARLNGVILTGFIKGEKLNQIFSHARLFVLPSYHEGLPISLLEAMSYDLDVLVSDIPANLDVNLDNDDYFKVGDISGLKKALESKIAKNNRRDFSEKLIKYDWDVISERFALLLNRD